MVLDHDLADDAGLFSHFSGRGLREGLLTLDVALGQTPLHTAGPIATGDDSDSGLTFIDVDDHATGTALLNGR